MLCAVLEKLAGTVFIEFMQANLMELLADLETGQDDGSTDDCDEAEDPGASVLTAPLCSELNADYAEFSSSCLLLKISGMSKIPFFNQLRDPDGDGAMFGLVPLQLFNKRGLSWTIK